MPFTTTNGTATGGSDFTPTSGSVTFAAGETIKAVPIQMVGDNLAEPLIETFTVQLSPPAGLGPPTVSGTVTIIDDDGTATLTVSDVTVLEPANGSRAATFTVSLNPPSAAVVTVGYFTSAITATGSDVTVTTGTLTFQSGETSKSVDVPVLGDGEAEPTETFALAINNPTGGAVIGDNLGTGTIHDCTNNCVSPQRPAITIGPSVAAGKLNVSVATTNLNTGLTNPIQSITFGQSAATNPPRGFQNAKVTMNNQVIADGQTVQLAANTTSTSFTVERTTAGQPTTVNFTVTDQCGSVVKFVGGGVNAGF